MTQDAASVQASSREKANGSSAPLLSVSDLEITRETDLGRRLIVKGFSIEVDRGETVGIVGESGSGKSMTARALVGLLPVGLHADGHAQYAGRELMTLRERGWRRVRGSEIGLVMQDPFTMLNPLVRCGAQITEALIGVDGRRLRGAKRREEAVRRLAEVGITNRDFADAYPFQLSGGMRQRVAIAAALARNPQLLIADEPSTALDTTTQREILGLLKSLQQTRGMALILITHDLRVAFSTCDRIHVLYAGSLLEASASAPLHREPLHPYTLGLLLSEPPADRRVPELVTIPGNVPAADDVTGVCPFSPRCDWATAVCTAAAPPLHELEPGRLTACLRVSEIREEMSLQRSRGRDRTASSEDQRGGTGVSLLSIRGLEKRFHQSGGKSGVVHALKGVSLELAEGESVALAGESGSGKTTLARCVLGLESATGGEIVVDGIDISDWSALTGPARRRARQTVQIVFQDPYSSLNPVRTVGATLKEALEVRNNGPKQIDIEALLSQVGLPPTYARRKPIALSGGERQRVAIARALAVRPRLLVCDEPVSALDVSVQAQILNLLKELRASTGTAYLFITHDLAVARQATDRIYVMYRGEIVESGETQRVLSQPSHEYTQRLIDAVPRDESSWPQTAE